MQVIQRSFLKRLCLFLHEGNTATQFKMIYGQLWQPRLLLITLVYRSTSEPSWTPGLWKWYHIGKFAYSSWVHPVYIRLFKLGLSNRHCRARLRCADRRYLPSKYLIIFPMNDFFFNNKNLMDNRHDFCWDPIPIRQTKPSTAGGFLSLTRLISASPKNHLGSLTSRQPFK